MSETKKVKLAKIVSNASGYGPMPEEYDEVEQHLTLRSDGRYWLSRYEYGEGYGNYRLSNKSQGKLFKGKEIAIFEKLSSFCAEDIDMPFIYDCGSWNLSVIFTDETKKEFAGSLGNINQCLSEISSMIRMELDMYDLFLFDGHTSKPYFENGPIPVFEKYLPLLYENTYLWNRFQELCERYFYEEKNRKDYFAFQRDPECIKIWFGFIDNMGGGVPIDFFTGAAFLILSYKENGHDIDAELALCPHKNIISYGELIDD